MSPDRLHTLYRFFDERDVLLYVGITMNPGRRFEKHKSEKAWWTDIDRIELEQHADREALAAAERLAIQSEKPLYNIRMNGGGRLRIPEIAWPCTVCGRTISDGEGYLTVSYEAIAVHRQAFEAFEAMIVMRQSTGRGVGFTLNELPDTPRAEWVALHSICNSDRRTSGYGIPVEQIRSQAEALSWTAALLEKPWIHNTDWASVIRRAASDGLE